MTNIFLPKKKPVSRSKVLLNKISVINAALKQRQMQRNRIIADYRNKQQLINEMSTEYLDVTETNNETNNETNILSNMFKSHEKKSEITLNTSILMNMIK